MGANRKRKAVGFEGTESVHNQDGMPRKRLYRARAHSNPLNDSQFAVPVCPEEAELEWAELYPHFYPQPSEGDEAPPPPTAKVRMVDVGCGFGGLLVNLAPLFPSDLILGIELRDKVSEYVKERVACLRKAHPGQYQNITCIRSNAMKYLPNYFDKGQLQKLFFLFPDPHFKTANHRRRIVTRTLLAEYAYALAVGAKIYTVTDVPELHEWMTGALEGHPLFERVPEQENEADPCVPLLTTSSEEGQKVQRNEGLTCINVFRRIAAQ